jgi:hypothetical protein
LSTVPATTPLDSERVHRRQTRNQIWLPIIGGIVTFFGVIGAVIGMALIPNALRVSAVADVLLSLLILFPLIFCLLPIYLVFFLGAVWLGRLHTNSATQLRRLNRFTRTVTDQTIHVTETINRETANLRVKIAGVEHVIENAYKPKPDSPIPPNEGNPIP